MVSTFEFYHFKGCYSNAEPWLRVSEIEVEHDILHRWIWGRDPSLGEILTTEKSGFWVSKLQIFGAEGAKIFEKIEIFKDKLPVFVVLGGNLAKFQSI